MCSLIYVFSQLLNFHAGLVLVKRRTFIDWQDAIQAYLSSSKLLKYIDLLGFFLSFKMTGSLSLCVSFSLFL